jgi:hypothetical protein
MAREPPWGPRRILHSRGILLGIRSSRHSYTPFQRAQHTRSLLWFTMRDCRHHVHHHADEACEADEGGRTSMAELAELAASRSVTVRVQCCQEERSPISVCQLGTPRPWRRSSWHRPLL